MTTSIQPGVTNTVTVATTGGKGGGGVTLTQFGEGLVDSYRALERDIAELAQRRLRSVIRAVTHSGPPGLPRRRP